MSVAAQQPPAVELIVTSVDAARDEAAGVLPFRVTVRNNLPVSIRYTYSLTFPNAGYDATIAGAPTGGVEFTLAANSVANHDFTATFPRRAGRILVDAELTWAASGETAGHTIYADRVELTLARRFTVTTNADDGEGSLRRTIEAVNASAECADVPCRIDFSLGGIASTNWATITPAAPLPRLEGKDVEVDATSQFDTNTLGPDVELLGTRLRTGDALEIRADRATVRGLAIGGFPGAGIFFRPRQFDSVFTFERNYLGVEPTGTRAVFNGQRGITIEKGTVRDSLIRDNVISGNGRSGIYIDTERSPFGPLMPVIRITGNRIGVAAASDEPIGNGASGIYLGPGSEWVRVEHNVIANNAHAGVAIANTAQYYVVRENRIARNRGLGIDIGIDGPGANHSFRNSNLAVTIDSAQYDPATRRTFVRGHLTHRSWIVTQVDLYFSGDSDAEGEQFLGSVMEADDDTFIFSTTVDLRGLTVTAIARGADDATWVETSEFSNGVKVE